MRLGLLTAAFPTFTLDQIAVPPVTMGHEVCGTVAVKFVPDPR